MKRIKDTMITIGLSSLNVYLEVVVIIWMFRMIWQQN